MAQSADPLKVTQNVATLVTKYMTLRGTSLAALAKQIGLDSRSLKERLGPVDPSSTLGADDLRNWKLAQILRAGAVLGIPDEEIADAILPRLATRLPSIPQLERKVRDLEDQNMDLRDGRYEPQSATRELLRTGRWALSALPHVYGPDPEHEVVMAVNISVAPLGADEAELSVQDIRARLAEEVPGIYRRATVMSGDVSHLPSAPGAARSPAKVALNLSIPVFSEDREAAPHERRTHFHYTGEGVLVISSTLTAGSRPVAAILARALGWGLVGTRTRARTLPAQVDAWSGAQHRQWLRQEGNRQLTAVLFEKNDYRVISHAGYADPGGLPHPLIAAIDALLEGSRDDLPYIVLLHEDNAVLESASQRRVQEDPDRDPTDSRNQVFFDRLVANRDALWSAVTRLPDERRMIVPVRDVAARPGEPDWTTQSLRRSATAARHVLDRLTGDVDALRIIDRDAATILAGVRGEGMPG